LQNDGKKVAHAGLKDKTNLVPKVLTTWQKGSLALVPILVTAPFCCREPERQVRKASLAARKNTDHPTRSPCYCLFAPQISECYASCISHTWWIAHSMQCQLRGCNSSITQ